MSEGWPKKGVGPLLCGTVAFAYVAKIGNV